MKKNIECLVFLLWLMGIFVMLVSSCKKDEAVLVLTTSIISNITDTTAFSGGDITSDGGSAITARGVCWSTAETPIISDNKTIDGTGVGSYTSIINGLKPNTSYYVRAYATNSAVACIKCLAFAYTPDILFNSMVYQFKVGIKKIYGK